MLKGECDEYSAIFRKNLGWDFGFLIFEHFGDCSIVLSEEGSDGRDVEFKVSIDWLDRNRVHFSQPRNDVDQELIAHMTSCQSAQCAEAMKRAGMLYCFLVEGELSEHLILGLIDKGEYRESDFSVIFSRKNGDNIVIDELLPFMRWFIDDRNLWEWPEEKKK